VIPYDADVTGLTGIGRVWRLPQTGTGRGARRFITFPRRFAGLLRLLARVMRVERPEVLHAQVLGGWLTLAAVATARRLGIPTVVKFSSASDYQTANRTRYARQALRQRLTHYLRAHVDAVRDRLTLRLSNRIWVTSPQYKALVERAYSQPAEKMIVLPNFITVARFRSDGAVRFRDGRWSILTVCRLRPWKGVEDCLVAASLLPRGRFRWRIIGDGPERFVSHLRLKARELQLEGDVHFVGGVTPEVVHRAYREADVCVLLSHYEPFGIVLLEAMAAGVPVITTETDGIPSFVVHNETGVLVPVGQPQRAARAIRELMEDRAASEALARRALERVNAFDVTLGAERLERLYAELAGVA
jgi:glycosyltransferase involved in cell wall biosynthesis